LIKNTQYAQHAVIDLELKFTGISALGRMGRPRDVVNMTRFLASDEAGFITGGEFAVDGGLTVGLSNSLTGALWGE